MALLHFFQVTASLPTAEETALGDTVTQSANGTVLREVQAEQPRKRKPYTSFTAEQRATIGKYASEHGNAAAVKKFKANIEGGQLGEITVRLFKKRYFEELKKAKHSGATVPEVKSIASRKRGRPLTLGDTEFISAYDHIQSNPDIVKNGFTKVGITETLENGFPEADAELDLQDLSENDPFSSDSD